MCQVSQSTLSRNGVVKYTIAGFPESSFTFSVISFLFFSWLVSFGFGHESGGYDRRWRARAFGLACITALITLGISGFQLGEFIRFLPLAVTSHTSEYGMAGFNKPLWLLALLFPNFFGHPFVANWFTEIRDPHNYMITSLFCGISTVILALAAIIRMRPELRRYSWFFIIVLVVFVGYDYHFPILKNIGRFPILNFSSTAWNVFVIPFSISVLAGLGLDSLRFQKSLASLAVAILAYFVLCLVLSFPLLNHYAAHVWAAFVPLGFIIPVFAAAVWFYVRPKYAVVGGVLLLGLLIREQIAADHKLSYKHYYNAEVADPPSLTWLASQIGHERFLGLSGVFASNFLMPWQIRDLRFSEAMFPGTYVDYIGSVWPTDRQNLFSLDHSGWTTYREPLFDLASVKFIAAPHTLPEAPDFTKIYDDGITFIYRSDHALARARFVGTGIAVPEDFSVDQLKSQAADLQNRVLLAGYPGATQPPCAHLDAPAEVTYLTDDPDQVRLNVTAPCAGFVVLSDLYYPGWQATVDDQPVLIYRANVAFRAVEISAGKHVVTFSYTPWTLRYGAPLSLLTSSAVIMFLGYAAFVALRRRTAP